MEDRRNTLIQTGISAVLLLLFIALEIDGITTAELGTEVLSGLGVIRSAILLWLRRR